MGFESPLEHILNLICSVALQVLDTELLASLLTSDELTLDPEPAIRDLLPAVVADLLLPDTFFP
jgi:hypothetical protein